MKYYKQNSIPLEEEYPGLNELSIDQFGNFIQIDAFGDAHIIKQSVLRDDERIDFYIDNDSYNCHTEAFLKGFWAQTKKMLEGYEVQDADQQEV